MENGADSEARDPSGFLSQIIGAPVIVKLNSGIVFKGHNLKDPRCHHLANIIFVLKGSFNPSMAI